MGPRGYECACPVGYTGEACNQGVYPIPLLSDRQNQVDVGETVKDSMVIKLSRSYVIINPFTPKSDQFQISPAGSPEILHHTVWRTWLFILLLPGWKIALPILTTSLKHFFFKGWENLLFERGSGRVKREAFREMWGGFLSNCKQSLRNTFDAVLHVLQELKSNRTIYMGAMWKAASSSGPTFGPNRDHNWLLVASRSSFSPPKRSFSISIVYFLPAVQTSQLGVSHSRNFQHLHTERDRFGALLVGRLCSVESYS